jgi:hypothetical protein
MPETKKKIKLVGVEISVFDVPIKSASETFGEYELEDGSRIRVKFVASSFMRVEGEYGPDGKPFYLVFSSPAVNVLDSPETLMGPRPKSVQ